MITIIIKIAVSIAAGVLAGFSAVYIFNRMPAEWLCDYGEKPSDLLKDPYVQRVKGFPWRWIYAAGFSCLMIRATFTDIRFAAAVLAACWALLVIGLADLKYKVIPDQFVILLAISALGFVPWYSSLWQPAAGAAAGGGIMMMVSVLGGAAAGREVMGFGDVKLSAAIGLAFGLKGAAFVLIATSLLSGITAAAGLASGRYRKDDMRPLGPYICGCGAFYAFIIWPFLL